MHMADLKLSKLEYFLRAQEYDPTFLWHIKGPDYFSCQTAKHFLLWYPITERDKKGWFMVDGYNYKIHRWNYALRTTLKDLQPDDALERELT